MEICNNIIHKAKNVIFNSTEFFEEMKEEKDIKKPLIYLAVLEIVPAIFSFLMFKLNLSTIPMGFTSFFPASGIFAVILIISTYLAGVIGMFISAAIVYVLAMLFGGSGNYNSTFKALVYGSTPALLAAWIPLLGIIAWLDSIYLEVKGISKLHDVSMLRAFGILIIPGLVLFAIVIFGALFYYGLFSTTSIAAPGATTSPIGNFLLSAIS